MKTRSLVAFVLVFMVVLSFMPSGSVAGLNLDGMAPSSARDIPVLRFDFIDIINFVADILSPALGPHLG